MYFDYLFKKFFWFTTDHRLACANSTTGDENGLIDAATLFYPNCDEQDEFYYELQRVIGRLGG